MKRILLMIIIGILCLSMFGVLLPKAQGTALSDDFTSDTSLNTSLWQINGPVGTAVANAWQSQDGGYAVSIINPTLTFSSATGMGISGVSSNFQISTIQSLSSFSAPFTLQASVMSTLAYADSFALWISSSDGNHGVGIDGNLGTGSGYYGIWESIAQGAGWSVENTMMYSSPQLNTVYQLSINVDTGGTASLAISSNGQTLGTASRSIGVGPFYILLIQLEGWPAVSGPNQAYWQSVTLTSSTVSAVLSDNFTQDTSLNTQLWVVNGPIGDSVAPLIYCGGGSPVSPDLTFSATEGMGVAGANNLYEFSTIVSQASFTPPFTAQAVAMGSSSYGNTFVFALTTSDGSQGVSLQGNLNPNNYLYYGMHLNTGPGSASTWNSQNLYTSPSINVWYTLNFAVDASGSASVTVSSQGTTLATGTAQIGTGPFYVLLGQGEGWPVVSGPNQAYWQSVTLTSSAQTYSLSFTESGLPSGTTWVVTLNGVTSPSTFGSTITFNEANGEYTFSVTSSSGLSASPSSNGMVNVHGDTNIAIMWGSNFDSVDIHEVGLPQGYTWSATYSTVTETSTTQDINFLFPGGIYHFIVSSAGYTAEPSNVDINAAIVCASWVIFIPSSNPSEFCNWDPVLNSYNIDNQNTIWSTGGNCYGFSSTAILYFRHYVLGDNTYPYYPSQYLQPTSTSDLDLSGILNSQGYLTTLNSATLAIMFHQIYDPSNYFPLTIDEKVQFDSLLVSLSNGIPVVLTVPKTGLWPAHAVVAWGAGELANGSYAIAVYDPDHCETTWVAVYDPSTNTFSFGSYSQFAIVSPTMISTSWQALWNLFGASWWWNSWLSLSVQNYDIVVSDSSVTITKTAGYLTSGTITPNVQKDYFTSPGNSQTFVGGITGSSGIEEGNMQVYAIPEGTSYSVDPATNQSTILITCVDNESGQLVGHGYLLNATTAQGPLNYTVTPSSSGLSINAGDNALNATIIFFSATPQDHSVFETPTTQLGPMQEVNFTVTNWQMLNSTSPLPVTETTSDVAVIGVSPYGNWTYQGRPMNVNVTVANLGDYAENATVNLCYNGTEGNGLIGTEPVGLAVNETETLTFTWNTKGVPLCYDGYNITASIDISPEIDSNLTNNVLQSPLTVQVRIRGDVNGTGTVDISDISVAAAAFGSHPGMPNWNAAADVNGDGVVDIMDIALIASNFGQHYP
jgi:hypothetical protein